MGMDIPNPAKASLRIGRLCEESAMADVVDWWWRLRNWWKNATETPPPPYWIQRLTAWAEDRPPPPKPPKPRVSPWTREQLIIEASKIALSRRYRNDDERFEAMLGLAGEDPQDQFDALRMLSCVIFVLEELGSEAVVQIRDRAESRLYQ
jgi:hypothetical protein